MVTDKTTGKSVGLGETQPGRSHDTDGADAEGYTFPQGSQLFQDTGFQGYAPPGATIHQPKKKPRKQEWTAAEKAANPKISRQRIGVEQSMGGIKIFHSVANVFRNVKEQFVEQVMETVCGLCNLRLTCQA